MDYSNTNFIILGMIAVKIANRDGGGHTIALLAQSDLGTMIVAEGSPALAESSRALAPPVVSGEWLKPHRRRMRFRVGSRT